MKLRFGLQIFLAIAVLLACTGTAFAQANAQLTGTVTDQTGGVVGKVAITLRDVGTNLGVRGWTWWRKIALPAIFPFYVTGAITASGGSWNASIVAEVASWGDTHLEAKGLGAYIAQATEAGDYHRIVLGIAVMSAFVIIINRAFWRPLYSYAERKFRLS